MAERHNQPFCEVGVVTRILFPKGGQRSDNGFYIFLFRVRTIEGTVKGKVADCKEGMTYKLTGKKQFDGVREQVWVLPETMEEILDATPYGIVTFLATECRSVGEVMARKLVDRYGTDTLKKLKDPVWLSQDMPGMSLEQATKISNWYAGEEANMEVKKELYSIQLTPSQVRKILAAYGAHAKDKIKRDCFKLIELDGFGFTTVAKIADLMGISATDPNRIRAGIIYCFEKFYSEGDVCVPKSSLVREACELLKLGPQYVYEQIDHLIAAEKLVDSSNLPERLTIDHIIKTLSHQPKQEIDFGDPEHEPETDSGNFVQA